MKLTSPTGVTVTVSDEKGERLKAAGYREVRAFPPALSAPAPQKPRHRRKS